MARTTAGFTWSLPTRSTPSSPRTAISFCVTRIITAPAGVPPSVRGAKNVESNSQFFDSVAVDQTDGDVAVSWYDGRNDINDRNVDYMVAVSGDGGQTFSSAVAADVGPSNATLTSDPNQFGDYEGLAFNGGLLYPIWSDNDLLLGGNPSYPDMDVAAARMVVAHVTVPPPVVTAQPISATEGRSVSGVVATFTDANTTLDPQISPRPSPGETAPPAPSPAAVSWRPRPLVPPRRLASRPAITTPHPGPYVLAVTVEDKVHALPAPRSATPASRPVPAEHRGRSQRSQAAIRRVVRPDPVRRFQHGWWDHLAAAPGRHRHRRVAAVPKRSQGDFRLLR